MKNKISLKKMKWSALAALSLVAIASCKNNDPSPSDPPSNEGELITTMKLTMTDSASGRTQTYVFRDTDGDGGNLPTDLDTIQLANMNTYTCTVWLLDESKTPADTISREVEQEADEHLFVYSTDIPGLQISITDQDSKNLPLGLQTVWRVRGSGNGNVRVTLKHQPGVKDGSPQPGETDAEVNFPCIVR